MENNASYTDEQRDEVRKRLEELNDELKLHNQNIDWREGNNQNTDKLEGNNENIDDIKGKLKSQITNIRETINKVLDSDTTLGEKIRTLFCEQGITIFSIFTVFIIFTVL